jgi:pilus assembly protein CpaF
MTTPAWLHLLLQDRSVTDICLNGHQHCFSDRGGGLEPAGPDASFASEELLRQWILQQLALAGKTWDAKHPFVDAVFASGHRAHVAFGLSPREPTLVSLRKLPERPGTLELSREAAAAEAQLRWGESPLFAPLREAARGGEAILISGATGSGKTTLMNDLLAEVGPSERIIALEDTAELAPRHPHFLSLQSRPANSDGWGEVSLRTLLRQTLRMRPDRIVLGECRGPEVLELLQALNTGHAGAVATLHANSPREAIRRVELLCLLAGGPQITLGAIRELLALGIRWVAQTRKSAGKRRIEELWRVEGKEGETLLMRPHPLNAQLSGGTPGPLAPIGASGHRESLRGFARWH